MDRLPRLRMISKVTYYLGWAAFAVAVIGHLTRMNTTLQSATRISGRNLLEASLLLFLVCIASEVRALGVSK